MVLESAATAVLNYNDIPNRKGRDIDTQTFNFLESR